MADIDMDKKLQWYIFGANLYSIIESLVLRY